jgi:predicted CopG family antitoxin
MPVKTITIDMEAYDLMAAEKRNNESFSRVIKRKFRRASTAKILFDRLDEVCLSASTLNNLDKILKARSKSPAKSPIKRISAEFHV